MKALIVFLTFFIATPLFFINKFFITSGDTHYLAIAVINSIFILAAYIAIDCRNESRHEFWRGIFASILGLAGLWYSFHVMQIGYVPEEKGRGRLAYEVLNYIHGYAGGYGVFFIVNIFSGLSFYAAYKLIKRYT